MRIVARVNIPIIVWANKLKTMNAVTMANASQTPQTVGPIYMNEI
jgi:hypothetical protein